MKWQTYTVHVEHETGEILTDEMIYKKNLEVKITETKYTKIKPDVTEKTIIKLYGPRRQQRLF